MKKIIVSILGLALIGTLFAGCKDSQTKGSSAVNAFDASSQITVISREANSGTRGAFDELMKIVEKDGDKVTDKLFSEAIFVDSTDAVASKVEVDPYAIGYTSLGAISDRVKALSVDDIEPTVENVVNGSYKIYRPFILAKPKDNINPLSKDFISFILSKEGQEIVSGKNLITIPDATASYQSSGMSGKLTLSGSTSVEKVIEKLREEYIKVNPNVTIEVTYSGSSAGIKDAMANKVDLAMSSRELKSSETEKLIPSKFALDAIAVIVNPQNKVSGLSSAEITNIFTGSIRTWADVEK